MLTAQRAKWNRTRHVPLTLADVECIADAMAEYHKTWPEHNRDSEAYREFVATRDKIRAYLAAHETRTA